MRARFKGPAGTGTIEIPDDATVETLFNELRSRTEIASFAIKYGPPMAMKTLDLSQGSEVARSLGLHGESLTIVPDELLSAPTPTAEAAPSSASGTQAAKSSDNPEDVNIPWAEREGTLCESSIDAWWGGTVTDDV